MGCSSIASSKHLVAAAILIAPTCVDSISKGTKPMYYKPWKLLFGHCSPKGPEGLVTNSTGQYRCAFIPWAYFRTLPWSHVFQTRRGDASLGQTALHRGHLSLEHRHTRVAHHVLFFFLLRSHEIDIWLAARLALAKMYHASRLGHILDVAGKITVGSEF